MQLKQLFKNTYLHLIKIDDSKQRIALGMGLGVFWGMLPGAGPIISLIAAAILRVNKAAALLGCLATNTWISVVSAILAVKVGARVFNLEWQELLSDTKNLINNFSFPNLFNLAVLKILMPVLAGYLLISFSLALLTYLITLALVTNFRKD